MVQLCMCKCEKYLNMHPIYKCSSVKFKVFIFKSYLDQNYALWFMVCGTKYNVDKNGENKCKKLYSTMHVHTYVLLSYDFKKCHRLRNWFHQSLKSIIIDFETNRITCLNCTFLNTQVVLCNSDYMYFSNFLF